MGYNYLCVFGMGCSVITVIVLLVKDALVSRKKRKANPMK